MNLAEILEAYLRALDAGEAPDRAALLARHPDLAKELEAALDGLDFVQRARRNLGPEPEAADAAPGRALGDYRLVREVGRGGMAVVYEAEQLSLSRRVALKVLPFASVLDPKQLQRFKNEALAAAHLRHPNIVPVYAVGCERGVHYYAMQYVEGQSLAHAIGSMKGGGAGEGPRTPISSHGSNREPAFIRMAASLGVQAAEALDHAHQLGIVHRDVKPGNLLVDQAGSLWVTDFGLARSRHDTGLTMTGELLGTIRYMSPEQALAKRAPIDHRTDVYSLGATLYELFTLEPAFPGDDPHLLMQEIAFREPALPRRLNPAIPRDLETVVLKAMAKDPAARYATAQEMAEDLRRFLGDQPVLARRPSHAARAAMWARRHRTLVRASLAAALLGVATLALATLRVADEQRKTSAALKEAHSNLRTARLAVDKFLVESGVANLEDRPLPAPSRREMLELALGFYDRYPDAASAETRANIFHALHRFEDALAIFDAALAANPRDAGALVARAHLLWHLDRNAEALAAAEEAARIAPERAEAHFYRGMILGDLGRPEEALEAYDLAIGKGGEEPRFHVKRSQVLLDLRRTDDALTAAARATDLAPEMALAWDAKGVALQAVGKLDDALRCHERALAIDGFDPWLHTNYAFALEAAKRVDEALREHGRAIAVNEHFAEGHVHRGNLLRDTGRPGDAEKEFRRAIGIRPNLPQAYTGLGNLANDRGDHPEALREYRRALEIAPESARVRVNVAGALLGLGDPDSALTEIREVILRVADLPEAHLVHGNVLAAQRKLPEAEAAYRRGIALRRDFHEALGGLGNVLRDQGRFRDALEAYEQVARIRPDYAIAPLCAGTMCAALGEHGNALACFEKAIGIEPGLAPAHHEKGKSLLAIGKIDEAIEAFLEAARLRSDAGDHCMLGVAYREKRDFASSIASYRKSIELKKDYAEAWSNLGRVLNDIGEFDEAISALNEAIRLRPDLPEARLNLGISFSSRKEPEKAIREFEEVIRLLDRFLGAAPGSSDSPEAHYRRIAALACNGLGQTLGDLRRVDEAKRAYRRAIELDPGLAPAHYGLGKELYGEGEDDEAIREYRRAIDIEADFAEAYCGIGMVLTAQGSYVDALPWLRKGHEIGSRRPRWTMRSAEWIRTAETRAAIECRLEPVLRGEERPRDAAERCEFGLLLLIKARPAEAARMYAVAFSEDAALAEDLDRGHRYNAACAACREAARGAGDAAGWRARALAWLRADLAARGKAGLSASLDHWKRDPDLAAVRDRIDEVPEAERAEWKALWVAVEAALGR